MVLFSLKAAYDHRVYKSTMRSGNNEPFSSSISVCINTQQSFDATLMMMNIEP